MLLRYSLGGDRPSQTTHQTLSATRITVTLEHQTLKGGISRSAPCRLASTLQSLPPILHIKAQCSVSSYSKGSRGLSVLPRVHCIFTASSISLSLGWRQPGHHYAIRAGRNLPDKEFRYLRTVIVMAAVYRGLIRASLALTPSINLPAPGRRHTNMSLSCLHSAVFLINSCSQLVSSRLISAPSARDFTYISACLLPKLRHHFA